MTDKRKPCNTPTDCGPGEDEFCNSICLPGEDLHLQEPLSLSGVPTYPVNNEFHRSRLQPQCNDEVCGQRIQFITMQGHEIRMMDTPSEASNISITTSDANQHIRLDEMNMISLMTSKNHHFIQCDQGHEKAAIGQESAEVKYVDPNSDSDKLYTSSYQLIQTEMKHKFWLADTPEYPRIHASTIKGHEVLLLDESPQHPKGKIQITTYDKLMQIVMDLDKGEIQVVNNNPVNGAIKMHALGNIELHSCKDIKMFAGKNIRMQTEEENIELHSALDLYEFVNGDLTMGAPDGTITGTDNSTTLAKLPSGSGEAPEILEKICPGPIEPTVLVDLVKTLKD